jgi:hypothetical protein
MITIGLSALALTFFLGLATLAFAEESTIDVPFEIAEQNCVHLIDPETNREHYRCFWSADIMEDDYQPTQLVPIDYDCVDIGLVYDPESDSCITAEQLEKEAKENYHKSQEVIELLSEDEQKISEIKSSHDYEEKVGLQETISYLEKPKSICSYDVSQSQTYEQWDVRVEIYIDHETGEHKIQWFRSSDMSPIDLQNYPEIENEKKAVELCYAQAAYRIATAPGNHLIVDDEFTPATYHANIARSIDPISQSEVESLANKDQKPQRYSPICDVAHSTIATKVMYGCPVELNYQHNPSMAPQMKDYAQTSPYQAWLEYNNNPESHLEIVLEKSKQKDARKYLNAQK